MKNIDFFPKIDGENFDKWFENSQYSTWTNVSYYDHRLSTKDIEELVWFTYSEAIEYGKTDEFDRMAISFRNFYYNLSLGGAFSLNLSGEIYALSPSEISNQVYSGVYDHDNSNWDFYFPEMGVRAISGWDFTDLFLLEGEDLTLLQNMATKARLHVLSSRC